MWVPCVTRTVNRVWAGGGKSTVNTDTHRMMRWASRGCSGKLPSCRPRSVGKPLASTALSPASTLRAYSSCSIGGGSTHPRPSTSSGRTPLHEHGESASDDGSLVSASVVARWWSVLVFGPGRLRASRQRYTTDGQRPASMGTRWDGWISPGRISTGYRSAHAPDEGAPGGTTARAVLPSLCVQRRGSDGGNACPPSGWCFWAGARCVAPPRARARAVG
jgi:hypothetical protein